jgi:SNF2 family DNA or RNA helicase
MKRRLETKETEKNKRYKSKVSLQLRTLKTGITDEYTVATREPVIAIVTDSKQEPQIRNLLVTNDVKFIGMSSKSTKDEVVSSACISVHDASNAIDILESNEYEIDYNDSSPLELIESVASYEVDTITEQDVIDKVGAELWNKLRGFQKSDVLFAINRKRVYIANDMGLGKTLETLVIVKYFSSIGAMLIVAPRILSHTWQTEIKNWIGSHVRVVIIESTKQLYKHVEEHDVLIVSYGLIYKPDVLKFVARYKIIVCDEAHNLQTRDSKRTLAVIQTAQAAEIRICLSGTPFSMPSQMYGQLKILYPDIYPSFFSAQQKTGLQYGRQYCKPTQARICGHNVWEFRGYDRQEELGAVLSNFLVRHTKYEVLKQLPEKIRTCITLKPLTQEQYDEIELEKQKEQKTWGVEKIPIKKFDFMDSFRLTSQYKLPNVLEFISDYLLGDIMDKDPDLKALIFCHHSATLDAILELLKSKNVSHCSISGKTKNATRNQYQDDFQAGKYSVMVLSITAASAGLTLHRASIVVMAEILFTAAAHTQAEDRAYRIGQKRAVSIFYLIEPRSTDEINWMMIKRKEREMTNILDGKPHELQGPRVDLQITTLDDGLLDFISKKRKKPDTIVETQPKFKVLTKRMIEQKEQDAKLLSDNVVPRISSIDDGCVISN